MSDINYDWVKEQMTSARLRRAPGDAVLKLLKYWEEFDLTPEQSKEALEAFKSLAQGFSLVEPYKDEVWVAAQPGQLRVSDEIRVRSNAFVGDLGTIHNGRRGVIVAVRSGDIVVRSTDRKEPTIDGSHYSPHHLEKRIK
jgi:hypothetical protein